MRRTPRMKLLDLMETTKRPDGPGLLGATVSMLLHVGAAPRKRGKRNPWIVVGFFWLVAAAWIKSQM